MRLEGKVALITGASSGIGKAAARFFAKEGARVVIACHNISRGEKVTGELKNAGYDATFVGADVRSYADCERMIQTAMDKYGRLDILVNNAGVGGESDTETTEERWHNVIETNLSGPFYASQLVIPIMKKQGGGNIVNVSSSGGIKATGRSTAYASSKAGLNMMTRSMARIHGRDNIRVNCVCPGPTDTHLWYKRLDREPTREEREAARSRISPQLPMGRPSEAEEVAYAILFLASDEASGISGAILAVDGADSA